MRCDVVGASEEAEACRGRGQTGGHVGGAQYPPHWVGVEALHSAMFDRTDPVTGRPRGYMVLGASPLARSVLLTLDRRNRRAAARPSSLPPSACTTSCCRLCTAETQHVSAQTGWKVGVFHRWVGSVVKDSNFHSKTHV